MKVKFFISKSIVDLQDEINEWLTDEFLQYGYTLVDIKQTESDSCWTISIWYKE